MKTAQEISTTVLERIQGASDLIVNKVVDEKVNSVVEKRAQILSKAIRQASELEGIIAECRKPDSITYDEKDQPIERFSAGAVSRRKNAEKELKELQDVIDKAIGENSEVAYDELSQKVNPF